VVFGGNLIFWGLLGRGFYGAQEYDKRRISRGDAYNNSSTGKKSFKPSPGKVQGVS